MAEQFGPGVDSIHRAITEATRSQRPARTDGSDDHDTLALVTSELSDIDIGFNVSSDTPPGRDPDSHSPTLREYHRLLWSKPLPDGTPFTLMPSGRAHYLLHESTKGRFSLSSDAINNQHRGLLSDVYGSRAQQVNDDFCRATMTVGGYILFPGERLNRKPTINQHRGMHPRIRDRFDLTLECIRRHYTGEHSPLSETLARYVHFFALFESFTGYVEHFLLHALVDGSGQVRFFRPFDGFNPNPLPTEREDYNAYLDRQREFVTTRNAHIAAFIRSR
ncbi:DUF6994 family protein [Pseudonocardia hydrocarbonoxydans]|uniref:DUF6994 family protein n=1 Tax=Pseudonocardia hydrocarbonoxydans TaxID=76726 RepID=UPI001142FF9C|nr:hypothetical protein [Pseudonocardia hydrocarbonoxydans]